MKAHLQSEKALTLVEILATLALLSIVFVGIMSVFSQMSLFNNKTYEKLDTMNLARQEMSTLKSLVLARDAGGNQPKLIGSGYTKDNSFAGKDDANRPIHLYRKTGPDYSYELLLFETAALKGDAYIGDLQQIHLKVLQDKVVKSESYGYLEAQ